VAPGSPAPPPTSNGKRLDLHVVERPPTCGVRDAADAAHHPRRHRWRGGGEAQPQESERAREGKAYSWVGTTSVGTGKYLHLAAASVEVRG